MSAVRMVTAVWARQMAALLEARGRPAEAVLREVGLTRSDIDSPEARIPFSKHVALLERAASHLGDACFGFHHGASLDPLDAGAIGYLAANSPTLKDALSNYQRYLAISTEGLRLSIEPEEDSVVLGFDRRDVATERDEQWCEFVLASAINVCRFVVGRRIRPAAVTMKHRRGSHLKEFEKYLGVPVSFGAARYTVVLNRKHLSLPCHSADARLFRIVKAHCDELLKKSRRSESLREEVALLIGSLLPTGTATSANVASTLGVSERTLARRLAEEGTSFRQIIEEQRQQMAFRYLEHSDFRPAQVAYLLGYAQPSAFTHAFRRWTGHSPSDYRNRQPVSTRSPGGSKQQIG